MSNDIFYENLETRDASLSQGDHLRYARLVYFIFLSFRFFSPSCRSLSRESGDFFFSLFKSLIIGYLLWEKKNEWRWEIGAASCVLDFFSVSFEQLCCFGFENSFEQLCCFVYEKM